MTNREVDIPLFPLNIFLLPGEQLPLHIFEPRYQQLFNEAKKGLTFGLPYTSKTSKSALVSECKLLKVTKEYESGESDVVIECIRITELIQFKNTFPGKLYPGGIINPEYSVSFEEEVSDELLELFVQYIQLKFGGRPTNRELNHYRMIDIAASIAMSNEDKIKFLKAQKRQVRENILANIMRYLSLLLQQEKQIENGFILN